MDEPINLQDLLIADSAEKSELPSPISFDELVLEQERDKFCQDIRKALENRKIINFRENPETGLLGRVQPDHFATVIPLALQPRLLHLALFPEVASHPGGRKCIKPFENITTGQALLPVATKQFDHLQHVPKSASAFRLMQHL
eukprot:IDg15595t1